MRHSKGRKYADSEPTVQLSSESPVPLIGNFTSCSFHQDGVSSWQSIEWTEDLTGAGTDAKFQVASNDDDSTWNFVGPDGTTSTYYEDSGQSLWAGHGNDSYVKYRAYLSDNDGNDTPVIEDVSIFCFNQFLIGKSLCTIN